MGWNGEGGGGVVGSRALSCNKRILGDKKLNDIWELVLYDVITYFTAVLFKIKSTSLWKKDQIKI